MCMKCLKRVLNTNSTGRSNWPKKLNHWLLYTREELKADMFIGGHIDKSDTSLQTKQKMPPRIGMIPLIEILNCLLEQRKQDNSIM